MHPTLHLEDSIGISIFYEKYNVKNESKIMEIIDYCKYLYKNRNLKL